MSKYRVSDICNHTFAVFMILLCAGCAADGLDEPNPEYSFPYLNSAYIEIYGGTPLGLPMTTRADIGETKTGDVSEPSTLGFCNADQLTIFAYKGETDLGTVSDWGFISYQAKYFSEITHFEGVNSNNKYSRFNYSFNKSGWKNYGFSFPSLAYSRNDNEKFIIEGDERNKKREVLKVELMSAETPEFFFGNIEMNDVEKKQINFQNSWSGSHYYNLSGTGVVSNCWMQGKLYRIVSQLNLNLSEVDERVVERLELMLENVPKTLKLYGNHGAYYPVGVTDEVFKNSAEGELTDVYIKVAEADASAIRDGKVKLSTFLLPSKVGRKISLRVHYKKGARIDEETGKEILVKDYPIEPASDVCLTETTSMVYYGLDATGNECYDYDEEKDYPKLSEDKSKICVYDSETKFFYSYSNIRVNINTKFSTLCPN